MHNEIVLRDPEQVLAQLEELGKRIKSFWNFDPETGGAPISITWNRWVKRRSLHQNSLYWEWMDQLANHFTTPSRGYDKDAMHDLMRHEHLGYEEYLIGNTRLRDRLKSTKKLGVHQMYEYMTKIDAWAAERGCLLVTPARSGYSEYKEARV